MLVLFLASALIGSGILFHHKRLLTYIALAGVLFEGQLLLTTFLHRTILSGINGYTFFLIAGVVYTTLWLTFYKKWKSPYAIPGSGLRDAYVGIALVIVFAAAYPIISRNGFQGEDFVMRGFYNGDVVTFASLVQKSFDTILLVQSNPFSGNGTLEYPTLLHGTVADFFTLLGIGKDWLRFLHLMVYVQIFLTIPLFFLIWDVAYPEPGQPAEKWFGVRSRNYIYALQACIALFAIGLSFDSFSYPQSHFFLGGLFLATIALFIQTAAATGLSQIIPAVSGFALASMLLFSNTVTGTAAAASAGVVCLMRIFDKKRSISERALFLTLGLGVIFLMKNASTGRTALNSLHFSVSSAMDMTRSGLTALLVLGASLYSLGRKQYLSITTSAVSILGFIIFFLSDRNIVTENASRFLYHGFLIGFPLLLPISVQAIYFIRRELFLTTRSASEKIGGYFAVLCIIGIGVLPIGISVGNTYLSLLRGEERRISLNDRTIFWWIDDNTKGDDIIITNPEEPYALPLFTGRSMLRAKDYWLSQDDETANNLIKAYEGDKLAQQKTLQEGSHIILRKDDLPKWDISAFEKMISTGDATVYKL